MPSARLLCTLLTLAPERMSSDGEGHLQAGRGTPTVAGLQRVDSKGCKEIAARFQAPAARELAHARSDARRPRPSNAGRRGQPQSLWNLMARVICR